jgi:hypothetical protein
MNSIRATGTTGESESRPFSINASFNTAAQWTFAARRSRVDRDCRPCGDRLETDEDKKIKSMQGSRKGQARRPSVPQALARLFMPHAKPSDRLPQLVTGIREPIFCFRRRLALDGALQKPIAFEAAQRLDQHLLGNIRNLLL